MWYEQYSVWEVLLLGNGVVFGGYGIVPVVLLRVSFFSGRTKQKAFVSSRDGSASW
jgi:hypothetical protein